MYPVHSSVQNPVFFDFLTSPKKPRKSVRFAVSVILFSSTPYLYFWPPSELLNFCNSLPACSVLPTVVFPPMTNCFSFLKSRSAFAFLCLSDISTSLRKEVACSPLQILYLAECLAYTTYSVIICGTEQCFVILFSFHYWFLWWNRLISTTLGFHPGS